MLLSGLRLTFSTVLFGVWIQPASSQLGPPSTDPACANPPLDQCSFYADCLETRYDCGPDGYPIGYGQYYCQKFLDNMNLFDAQGQQWVTNTMYCLQTALVGDAIDATPPATSCQALENEAFSTHPGCYVSNGFCTLGVKDWAAVLEIVGPVALVESWDAIQASGVTAVDCAAFYAFLVAEGLV